jgi:phage terminase large subunit-like protein
MLMFGLRLGDDPRAVVTTTPKPIKIIRELIADPTTVITRGSTYDNRANLAPAFLQQIVRKYEGTRLGRQELNAEILDDVPGALWSRALIEETRWPVHRNIPDLVRMVSSSGVDLSSRTICQPVEHRRDTDWGGLENAAKPRTDEVQRQSAASCRSRSSGELDP